MALWVYTMTQVKVSTEYLVSSGNEAKATRAGTVGTEP